MISDRWYLIIYLTINTGRFLNVIERYVNHLTKLNEQLVYEIDKEVKDPYIIFRRNNGTDY